jgi:hypothetical protein
VRVTDVELQVTRSEGGPPTTFERSNVIGVWQYLGRARSRRFLSLAILVGGLAAAFTLISGRGGRTLAVMGVAFAYYGVGSDADRRPRFEPVYLGPDFASCVYSTRRR